MESIIRAVRLLSQACGFVAAFLIALGVLVICDMVIERYLLGLNTIWQTDFVIYSLIGATFVGSPYVLLTRGHVNVDVLPHYAGPRLRYALALFGILLSLAFALTVTVLAASYWLEAWQNNWHSDTVWRARLWIPYAAMPLGLGILSLQYLVDLFCLLSGREAPFGGRPGAHG